MLLLREALWARQSGQSRFGARTCFGGGASVRPETLLVQYGALVVNAATDVRVALNASAPVSDGKEPASHRGQRGVLTKGVLMFVVTGRGKEHWGRFGSGSDGYGCCCVGAAVLALLCGGEAYGKWLAVKN